MNTDTIIWIVIGFAFGWSITIAVFIAIKKAQLKRDKKIIDALMEADKKKHDEEIFDDVRKQIEDLGNIPPIHIKIERK